ncbi:MAG TPA: hypothetical protein VFD36_29175 [Kofleriaceae bacterium]|nr:hypothetical protein [Kofleriaceae bacterium]
MIAHRGDHLRADVRRDVVRVELARDRIDDSVAPLVIDPLQRGELRRQQLRRRRDRMNLELRHVMRLDRIDIHRRTRDLIRALFLHRDDDPCRRRPLDDLHVEAARTAAQPRLAFDALDVIARDRIWKLLRVIRDERGAIAFVEHGQPGVELFRRRCRAHLRGRRCRPRGRHCRPRALDARAVSHRRGTLLAADQRD